MPKIHLSNQCVRSTEHKHTPAHATSNLVQISHIPTPTQPPIHIHIFTHMQLPAPLPPSHTSTYATATASLLVSFTLYYWQPPRLPHTHIHTYATASPLASFTYSHICLCQPPCLLLHICHCQPPCLLHIILLAAS